jgi:hypothetical protein
LSQRPINKIVAEFAEALDAEAKIGLSSLPTDDTGRVVYEVIRRERREGRLQGRVRRFLNGNPAIVRLLFEGPSIDQGIEAVHRGVLEQIAMELIEDVVGEHPIPRGIEEGDIWLAPSTKMQRMLMDRLGEDAVMIIVAKRDEDGTLQPAFAWTETPEVIAEAQKGHRRYLELLARGRKGER